MSSTPSSKISAEGAAELLATAKDPSWRDFNRFGAPRGRTPRENFAMLLDLLRFLEPVRKPPDRSLPIVKSFIL